MASQQVAISAIATPAPGKLDRFVELTADAIEYIHKNEPGTLQFEIYKAETENGTKCFLIERYASQQALEEHEGSEKYKQFFGKVTEEGLLTGAPEILQGKPLAGFVR